MRLYLLTLFYFSANAILNVIIPLQGEALGASHTTIGIIMGAYLFTTMFFRPWAGAMIQKHGSVRVLRVILIVNGLALMLYAMTGLGGYFFARMLQGVSTAFFSMALQLGIIDALPEKDRSQGISMYSLCSYIPGIIGPILALTIWQSGELNYFAVVMLLIALGTGVIGFSVKPDKSTPNPAKTGQGAGGMLRSLGQLATHPSLRKCSILLLSASVVFGAITTFIPLYAAQVEHGSAGVYLMTQAAVVVSARFLLRKHIPSDGRWHASFVMGMMLMLAAGAYCVSYSSTGGAVIFYLGAILIGIAQALVYPTLTTYLTFVLPQTERNVLMGLFIAMADLGVSLGGILMGPLTDLTSYTFMYAACAVLGASMVVVAYERRGVRKAVS
nr:MFS transporter [Paenibacillus phyllosphaerae]